MIYAYDRTGQRIRMQSGNRDVQYGYGRNGELILVRDVGQRLEARYEYDSRGRETVRTYGNGVSWDDDILIANYGNRDGRPTSVVIKTETGYLFFSGHKRYNLNLPHTQVEFNNNETIIYRYSITTGNIISKNYYENGILMKIEHGDGHTETYTVSSGTGEIIIKDVTGEVVERSMLERRINETGYLVYEAVSRQQGNGYEYFFTKDTF